MRLVTLALAGAPLGAVPLPDAGSGELFIGKGGSLMRIESRSSATII
jgi:hypothetical protein